VQVNNYQKIKSEDSKTNTFEFATSAGYFVSDNVLFGAIAGYSSSIRKVDNDKESESNIYSGGVFARYFYSPTKKYSFFNEFSAVYAHGETTSYATSPSQTVDVDGIGGEISIGFVYFVTKSFGLQASFAGLTYTSASFDEFENSAAEGFTIGGDLTNLRIGAIFKL
jgi:outer membrane protein